MDSGELDFYQHTKVCSNTCRSTKIDLTGARVSLTSQTSTEYIPLTPASADGMSSCSSHPEQGLWSIKAQRMSHDQHPLQLPLFLALRVVLSSTFSTCSVAGFPIAEVGRVIVRASRERCNNSPSCSVTLHDPKSCPSGLLPYSKL